MINRRYFLCNMSGLLASGLAGIAFHQVGMGKIPPALVEPPENGEWDWWRNLDRTLLTNSDDPFTSVLIRAAALRRELCIVYEGGRKPGETRKISPLGIFTVEGYTGTYAEAFCHKRNARRTFRIERISSVV